MKVSIITVCLNSESTINRTIKSVNKQDLKEIEHIFVDGGSVDKTLEVIKCNSTRNTRIFNQNKKGIYNAMNIGLKNCTGDIVLFLNSDDFLAKDYILTKVVEKFSEGYDIVFGNISYYNNKKKKLAWRSFNPGHYYKYAYKNGWHAPHPAFFIKRVSVKSFFDETNRISSDFEFMLKHQEVFKLKSIYLPLTCSIMANDGMSQKFLNIIKGNLNLYKSVKEIYPDVSIIIFFIRRFLFKFKSIF